MAKRTRSRPASGWLAPLESLQVAEGQITSIVDALVQKINEVIDLLAGKVSLGESSQGAWSGQLDAQYLIVVFPAAANTEQAFYHSLGRRPQGWVVTSPGETAATTYESRKGSWTDEVFYLKSTVGGVTVTVMVW